MNLLKTILPNQLVNPDVLRWLETSSPNTLVVNADKTVTFTVNSTGNVVTGIQINNTHRYYVKANIFGLRSSDWSWSTLADLSNGRIIYPSSANNGTIYYFRTENIGTFTTHLVIIDLTLLYGAGNEPSTVAQFRADYPLDYYPYSLTNTTGLLTCANGAVTADISSMLPSGIGVVDLGTLNWSYYSPTLTFYSVVGSEYVTSCEILCEMYRDTRSSLSSNMQMTSREYISANAIQIRNESYSDTTSFKNAMKGVLLFYKKSTS